MSKKIVIALGGNALGSTLHEQADAVQITAKAIVDLIAEGHEVIVAHGNGPQVGIINNAETLVERYFSDHGHQFMAMSSGKVNATELTAV